MRGTVNQAITYQSLAAATQFRVRFKSGVIAMSSKLDELRRRAEEAARQIDEKFEIKSKLDQGARAATGALRKGAEVASSTIDAAREKVTRLDREHRVSERVTKGARRATNAAEDAFRSSGIKDKAAEAAGDAAKKAGEVVDEAKQTASDLFGDARRYYDNASGAARQRFRRAFAVFDPQRSGERAQVGEKQSRQGCGSLARIHRW